MTRKRAIKLMMSVSCAGDKRDARKIFDLFRAYTMSNENALLLFLINAIPLYLESDPLGSYARAINISRSLVGDGKGRDGGGNP